MLKVKEARRIFSYLLYIKNTLNQRLNSLLDWNKNFQINFPVKIIFQYAIETIIKSDRIDRFSHAFQSRPRFNREQNERR